MKRMGLGMVVSLFAALGQPVFACSSFQLQGNEPLVGKSYDWGQSHGSVLINARNLKKTAFVSIPTDTPESWRADYGSVTFSQHGKDMPLGGINEKGLVVEILWLNETEFPTADSRPALNELQWIQYQLDKFETAQAVLADLKNRRISKIFADVHYMVCDATPECIVVEFLQKTEKPSHGPDLVANAITNDTYKKSAQHLTNYQGFGGTAAIPQLGSGSLVRFARLATQLQVPAGTSGIDHAFDLLKSVEQNQYTQFQIVYDPKNPSIQFRAPGQAIKKVDLSSVDFSCKTNSLGKWTDFHTTATGDITNHFTDFTLAENKRLAKQGGAVLQGSVPAAVYDALIDGVSKYPNSLVCDE
jgi:penicillin V acylase-like amidase (Ntn superfamily)